MSKGRRADAFDAVIVAITADDGLTGWGEMAPLGNFYSPAFAAGARAGVAEIAPHLIGQDPRALSQIARLMDTVFKGHPYIKSALDMACWDLAARAADMPLVTLLGGRDSDTAELYKVVTHGAVEAMAAHAARIVGQGFGRLQVKVGGNVRDDIERVHAVAAAVPKGTVIFCDANAGWTTYQALQFVDATRGLDYTFEQPCTSLDENASVRRALGKPMVLDESAASLEDVLEIHRRGLADGLTLKISRLGGVDEDEADPRPRGRARLHDHRRGYRRRRDRHGGHGASVAVDAGRAPAACHRLPRMGDGAHRLQHAAGHRQPHGRARRPRPRHRRAAGVARRAVSRTGSGAHRNECNDNPFPCRDRSAGREGADGLRRQPGQCRAGCPLDRGCRARRPGDRRSVLSADLLRPCRLRQGRRPCHAAARENCRRSPSASMPRPGLRIRRSRSACAELATAARQNGLAALSVGNSYACGSLGFFVEELAEQGTGRADGGECVAVDRPVRRQDAVLRHQSAGLRRAAQGPRAAGHRPVVERRRQGRGHRRVQRGRAAAGRLGDRQRRRAHQRRRRRDAGQPAADRRLQGFWAGADGRHTGRRPDPLALVVRGVVVRRLRRRAAEDRAVHHRARCQTVRRRGVRRAPGRDAVGRAGDARRQAAGRPPARGAQEARARHCRANRRRRHRPALCGGRLAGAAEGGGARPFAFLSAFAGGA